MTDRWKDVRTFDEMVCGDGCVEHVYYQTLDGTGPSSTRGDYAWVHEVDAARAKDAEDRQQEQQAHAAELAALHDIIAAYEAVTDPEQHPDLFARSSAVLEDCRNPACADQAVVQDLRDQLAAKDAEIARLRAQVQQWRDHIDRCAEIQNVADLYRRDPLAMADAIVRLREDVGALRAEKD